MKQKFGALWGALAVSVCLWSADSAVHVASAQTYPAKAIRLVMPFPGGGTADAQVRPITDAMRQILGQPIIFDPRPGAGGMIATRFAIEQSGDGYTLVLITNSSAIRSALPNRPFDIRKDLAHVAQTIESPMGIAVNPAKVSVKSVEELVNLARANPGKLNFSSYGVGTIAHLIVEYLAQSKGVKITHVPYNGSAAELTALLRGDSDAGVNALQAYTAQSPKLKVLAITSAERSELAPDIPGMRESGFDLDIPGWAAISAPAGTPPEVLNRLNAAVNQAIREPIVRDQYAKLNVVGKGGSREQITQKINREVTIFENVIRTGHIEIE